MQLSFNLNPIDHFSLEYFINHTGVAQAYSLLQQSVDAVLAQDDEFRLVYVYGPKGSGKSHLIHGFAKHVLKLGLDGQYVRVFDSDQKYEWIENFISEYERLKTRGLILISSVDHPGLVTINPHISSRFLAGNIVKIDFPKEAELKPVITSILERHNIKLADNIIEYLLKRLPLTPLSFAELFATIDRISLEQGALIRPKLMREVLKKRL